MFLNYCLFHSFLIYRNVVFVKFVLNNFLTIEMFLVSVKNKKKVLKLNQFKNLINDVRCPKLSY